MGFCQSLHLLHHAGLPSLDRCPCLSTMLAAPSSARASTSSMLVAFYASATAFNFCTPPDHPQSLHFLDRVGLCQRLQILQPTILSSISLSFYPFGLQGLGNLLYLSTFVASWAFAKVSSSSTHLDSKAFARISTSCTLLAFWAFARVSTLSNLLASWFLSETLPSPFMWPSRLWWWHSPLSPCWILGLGQRTNFLQPPGLLGRASPSSS